MKLIIKGKLPSLNEYIAEIAKNRYKGGKLKRQYQEEIIWEIKAQKLKKCKPTEIVFTWYEQNKRRDKDNISSFGKKLILDALVTSKILSNDNWHGYGDFQDRFEIDKKNPRIEVELL